MKEQEKAIRDLHKCGEDADLYDQWKQEQRNCTGKSDCWIACSERLPEENGEYEVTILNRSLNDYNKILKRTSERRYFYDGEWRTAKHLEVIAWMPLPEPFKEKPNEK